jgi:methyltransferase (TIGR00027 family)
MFPDQVSHTALLTAAARGVESARPGRLFDDPHAAALGGEAGDALLAEVGLDVAVPSIAIRTRFYDDAVRQAVGRGVRRVVLLGAGLDTRAYRLGLPEGVRWIEVDRAPVLDYKRRVLAGARPTVELEHVPGDACDPATFAALSRAGVTPDRATLWLVEGLLAFLGLDEIHALFGHLRPISGPGSEVLFDVPNLVCVNAQGAFARAGSALSRRGLRFGTDAPLDLARRLGIDATVVHEGHPDAHYGRREAPPALEVAPGSWAVYYVHGTIS